MGLLKKQKSVQALNQFLPKLDMQGRKCSEFFCFCILKNITILANCGKVPDYHRWSRT